MKYVAKYACERNIAEDLMAGCMRHISASNRSVWESARVKVSCSILHSGRAEDLTPEGRAVFHRPFNRNSHFVPAVTGSGRRIAQFPED
jgi:hypothetical protein